MPSNSIPVLLQIKREPYHRATLGRERDVAKATVAVAVAVVTAAAAHL
jgi:hypothetical protein